MMLYVNHLIGHVKVALNPSNHWDEYHFCSQGDECKPVLKADIIFLFWQNILQNK